MLVQNCIQAVSTRLRIACFLGISPGQIGAIQAMAPSFGVEVTPVNVRDSGEIEHAIAAFARTSRDGLIVTGSALTVFHRDLIVTLAARYKLTAFCECSHGSLACLV
jgi:hypothetical protein